MSDSMTSQNIKIISSDILCNNSIHIFSSNVVQGKNLIGKVEMFSFGLALRNTTQLVAEHVQFSIYTSSTNAGT